MTVNNLSQLKKFLQPGARFKIHKHGTAPENVGQIREVSFAKTNAIYSRIYNEPQHRLSTANGGKGTFWPYEKAKNYTFDGNTVAVVFNNGAPLMEIELLESDEHGFIDDKEKIKDFGLLSKDEFLKSYSYLSESEYEDTKLFVNKIKGIKEELETLIKSFNENGIPASENLENLCTVLDGHNDDGELFDFNYKDICSTVHLDSGESQLRLSDSCEIYDVHGAILNDYYQW